MDDRRTEIYDAFEQKLRSELMKLCTQFRMMESQLLRSDDIDAKWDEFARDYVIDAVHNFNDYPEFAIACAGYLGMAVACRWDSCWGSHHSDKYLDYYGSKGFDDMDEHILRDILGYALDSEKAAQINSLMAKCSELALTLVRREGFESQSVEAYYVLIRCVKVMFQIGESIELFRLGYKFEKICS